MSAVVVHPDVTPVAKLLNERGHPTPAAAAEVDNTEYGAAPVTVITALEVSD